MDESVLRDKLDRTEGHLSVVMTERDSLLRRMGENERDLIHRINELVCEREDLRKQLRDALNSKDPDDGKH